MAAMLLHTVYVCNSQVIVHSLHMSSLKFWLLLIKIDPTEEIICGCTAVNLSPPSIKKKKKKHYILCIGCVITHAVGQIYDILRQGDLRYTPILNLASDKDSVNLSSLWTPIKKKST